MGKFEFDIQNVASTSVDENGFLSLVPDAYGEKGGPVHEGLHLGGLWHCPLDPVTDPKSNAPDASRSAQMLTIGVGSERLAIPLHDVRTVPLLPLGKKGETALYSAFGSFTRHRADGAIVHATTDKGGYANGGTAVVDATTPEHHTRYGPWGVEVFDTSSYRLRHVGGASFGIGYAGGLAPGSDTYAIVSADTIFLRGTTIIGDPDSAGAVAKAEELTEIMALVATALTALQASVAATTTGGGGSAAPVAAAVAAIATMLESISTLSGIA